MRRVCMLIFLIAIIACGTHAQEKQLYDSIIDVQHYLFKVQLNDLNDEINANAEITVLFRQDTHTVVFDLICKNQKGKGMKVIGVNANEERAAFEHNANLLKIHLKSPAKTGDTRIYKISYRGIPANGLVFSKNKFKQRTIFADNWPNRARHWLPCVDHLSDKATVDFIVTAPDHYKVISNGELIKESSLPAHNKLTHWRETVALPTKVMVIGLADFVVNSAGTVDGIPVSSWVFPPDEKNGFYDYAQAVEILPFFIKKVGPYPYKKLANVEAITLFGGMENAGAIFYNEQSITGKRGYSEELIAHEIAHQWFGNSATESGWPHVWLSEGFATAMTNLYLENKYGADTLKARLKKDREAIIKFAKIRFTPIVDTSEKENYMVLLNRNSYEKGGWVLHMLRRKLGDTLFWKGMRTYYASYAGKNASTNDFQHVMESVAGIKLHDFFQQWLYAPGHPILQVKWKYDEKKKTVILYIAQEQKHLFSFPLEFAFKNGAFSKVENQTFSVKDKITLIEIPMATKPTQLVADPGINLLFQGNAIEDKSLMQLPK